MSATAPPLQRAHNIRSANGLIAAELRPLPDHRPTHHKSNSAGQVFMRRLMRSFRGRRPQHPHPPSTNLSLQKQDLTVPRVSLSESDPVLVDVPSELLSGTMMTKVSIKRQKRFMFRLDPDVGQIMYVSKKVKISTLPSFHRRVTVSMTRPQSPSTTSRSCARAPTCSLIGKRSV